MQVGCGWLEYNPVGANNRKKEEQDGDEVSLVMNDAWKDLWKWLEADDEEEEVDSTEASKDVISR